MTHYCQEENSSLLHFSCNSFQYQEIAALSHNAMTVVGSAERVGERIRMLRAQRQVTQKWLGEKIGSDGPRIHRIEKGRENPTLETLDKIASALAVDVTDLFGIPRPEIEAGHEDATAERSRGVGSSLLAGLVEALDGEVPAEDTWRGDVLKAIAVLNRALRRSDSGTAISPIAKTGR